MSLLASFAFVFLSFRFLFMLFVINFSFVVALVSSYISIWLCNYENDVCWSIYVRIQMPQPHTRSLGFALTWLGNWAAAAAAAAEILIKQPAIIEYNLYRSCQRVLCWPEFVIWLFFLVFCILYFSNFPKSGICSKILVWIFINMRSSKYDETRRRRRRQQRHVI